MVESLGGIVFTPSPALEWKFEELSGTTVNDTAGSNNGIITGSITRITDGFYLGSRALSWNATEYVQAGHSSTITPGTGDFSLSVWFRVPKNHSIAESIIGIVTKGDAPSTNGNGYQLAYVRNTSQFVLYLNDGVGATKEARATFNDINDGKWHHLVAIRRYNDVAAIYVDNVELPIDSDTGTDTVEDINTTDPFRLGIRTTTVGLWYGDLDQLRYYNLALNEQQIDALFNEFNYASSSASVEISDVNTSIYGASVVFSGTTNNTEILSFVSSGSTLTFSGLGFLGGILLSLPTEGGATFGGSAGVSVTLNFKEEYIWFSEGKISVEKEFSWNVGEIPLSWYMVEGECFAPDNCDNYLDINNAACGSVKPFQLIAARGISDLCTKLQEGLYAGPFKWAIKSIKRYTRPFNSTEFQESDACQELEEQQFCQILECLEYCLDYDVLDSWGAEITADINPVYSIPATGLLTFTPSALADSNFVTFIASGGVKFQDNFFLFAGDGGYSLTGQATVNFLYNYTPVGNLLFGGAAGIVGIKGFAYTVDGAEGEIVFTPDADTYSEYYQYVVGTGLVTPDPSSIFFTPSSTVISTVYNYTGTGGIIFRGIYGIGFIYGSQGGVSFSGLAKPDYLIKYLPSGNILFDGLASLAAESFAIVGEGGIVVSGGYTDNFLSIDDITWGANVELGTLEASFAEISTESNLTIDDGLVSAGCGTCLNLPLILSLSHNLNTSNNLNNFLIKNNFSLPKNIPIRYNANNNSWSQNYSFIGDGDYNNQEEKWYLNFDWQCTNYIAGSTLDDTFWKLSIFIQKTNLFQNIDFYSRVILAIPANLPCLEDDINISIKYHVQSKFGTITPSGNFVFELLTDEIGLFKNKYWLSNPYLNLAVNENVDVLNVTKYDIKPIFPSAILL